MGTPKLSALTHMNEFVKPVTLRAELLPDITRVRNHIIDNPRITVRELADALGIPMQQIRNAVFRLNINGIVRRSKSTAGEKRVCWEAGADDEYEKRMAEIGQPRQTIVSTWETCKLRDPMIDLLFGRNDKPLGE